MNKIKYSAFATTFLLAAFSIALSGFGLNSPSVVALGLVPGFVAGWCAGKAAWS
jgi:hypothetical protein